MLVLNLGEEFTNIMTMEEIVLPDEWHSFCISINIVLKRLVVFHNGNIQAVQRLEELTDVTADDFKTMTSVKLAGEKFVGTIFDFEVFGRPLPEQLLLNWTLCPNKELTSFFESSLNS
jgi:hypothetical protein